jgi:diacylglycerol O-acyltransferase
VSRIKLNNVDLAWLRMEHSTNPMMITVVLQFNGRINYERLIATLEVSLGRYRRFRQCIVRPRQFLSRPYWDDDPDYRIEDHVERVDLRLPADDAALQEMINKKMNTPLDFGHPLWKLTLANNHPDGSIILVRVHHCIADGISLMQVLLRMTQVLKEKSADQIPAANLNRAEHPTDPGPAITATASPVFERGEVSPPVSQIKPGGAATNPGRATLIRNPTFIEIGAAIVRIIFRRPDPPSMFKGELGVTKKVVWSEPFSLPEIKKISHNKHATVNDVLLAFATGAIRRYVKLHNGNQKRNLRAFILVNLRGREFDEDLGNKFGLVFLTLPVDRGDPLDRLDGIKHGMDSLKASAEYAATYLILKILGQMPEWIEHLAVQILDTKGTFVITNVPGPRHPISLAGAPISSIKAWVPQSGRIGVGLSFISYNNQVAVGLNVDAGLMPDPEKFLELFTEEFKAFQAVLPAGPRD